MSVDIILLSFLQSQKDSAPDFQHEVERLALAIPFDKDGYLEADGGVPVPATLQISGFRAQVVPDGPELGLNEDLCRRIGLQLAELGDRFEREGVIKQEVVECLVHEVLNHSLSEDTFSQAVQSVLSNVPPGTEQEMACLAVAMTLTSQVGKTVPSLLRECCATTSSFIQRNYNYYIQRLTAGPR